MDSISKELNRMYIVNKELLEVLHKIGYNLIDFAKKNNYSIPTDILDLFNRAKNLINELNHPIILNKQCSVCNKLNPENAEFCCYCGSSLIITRMRQSDKSPENATEGVIENFI